MPNRVQLTDQLTDTIMEVIFKLSEGIPGAVRVLAEWLRDGPTIDPDAIHPAIQMGRMDDLDIVGSRLWVLYSDVCDHQIRRFLGVLRANQLGFLPTDQLVAWAQGRDSLKPSREFVDGLLAQVEEHLPRFQKAEVTT